MAHLFAFAYLALSGSECKSKASTRFSIQRILLKSSAYFKVPQAYLRKHGYGNETSRGSKNCQLFVPLGMRRPYSDELTYGPFSFGHRSERDFATLVSSVGLKEFSLQFISKNSMNEMN